MAPALLDEHFAVEGAVNDLLRCLRSPVWLILHLPGGKPGLM